MDMKDRSIKRDFVLLLVSAFIYIFCGLVHADTCPVPGIKANGSDGPIELNTGETLNLTVSLRAGNHENEAADWWMLQLAPDSILYYFDSKTLSMAAEYAPALQADLVPFGDIPILSLSGLQEGLHFFYFGVDLIMNGEIDLESLYYDYVQVNINMGFSGWWDIFIPSVDSNKIDAMYLTQEGSKLTGTNILSQAINGTIAGNDVQLLFDNYPADSFFGTLSGDTVSGMWDVTIPGYFKQSSFHMSNFLPGEELPDSKLQFAWTSHSSADQYVIGVMRDNPEGNCDETHSCIGIWEMNGITETNIHYNSDGSASETLIPGNLYRVRINAYSNGSIVDTTMDVHFRVSDN